MMSTFRTTFNIPEFSPKMNYQSKNIFIGSCFTENIGNSLKDLKFDIVTNPTGIVYNPVSICDCVHLLLNNTLMKGEDLGFYNDTWFSFRHHSRYSNTDKEACLQKMNEELSLASEYIVHADFLFLTFGSAYNYKHNKTNEVVANCHKFPAGTFSKTLLTAGSIVENCEKLFDTLFHINPKIKVIFTVSPVRHWKDGAIENQLSKSLLITAIHELVSKYPDCSYFPAYELMMDDLRDYRFYADDMLHPGATAIEYIRNKFVDTFIDKDAVVIMNEIQKLILAKNHRPFRADTDAHGNFRKKQLEQILVLKSKHPFLDLKDLEEFFK